MIRARRLSASGFTVVKFEDDEKFLGWGMNPEDDVWAVRFSGGMVFEYRIERDGESWDTLWSSLEWENMASDNRTTEKEFWGASTPEMTTAPEAAKFRGVNRQRVCELARQGKIPGAEKVGGVWMIPIAWAKREI